MLAIGDCGASRPETLHPWGDGRRLINPVQTRWVDPGPRRRSGRGSKEGVERQEQIVQVGKIGAYVRRQIAEEIANVVQTLSQERCQHCSVEQTDDAFVPCVDECTKEENVEVARVIPQECLQRAVEEMVDVPEPQIQERSRVARRRLTQFRISGNLM